jgi:hypothetical protein
MANPPETLDGDLVQELDVDTFAGVPVNDWESTTTYAIFNDADAPVFRGIREELRELLLDRPIYEANDLKSVLRHARLMNSDRDQHGADPERGGMGHVVIRQQTTMRTKWYDVDPGDYALEG